MRRVTSFVQPLLVQTLLACSLACAVGGGTATAAAAQQSPAPGAPHAASELVTDGQGEASLTPDRAIVRVGVETHARTAADASARNARTVQKVVDTLRTLGYRVDSLRTVGFGVGPNYSYDDGRKLVDYQATATIRVSVTKLDRLGLTLDAVLGAGATDVSNVMFESDREREGRRMALEKALTAAREDATALARAAGGRLGRLLEATTQPRFGPMATAEFGNAAIRAGNAALPPQDVVVTVMVQARWELVTGS
jgi:uncharacterized protein